MDTINKKANAPAIYGIRETEYPDRDALGVSLFPRIKQQSFPQELEDQFKHMQSNFSTGLFPSISRAWMAIDSDLFLWNYDTNSDLAYFDGISNTILLVDYCKPRDGLSFPDGQFLLVVATTVEILLLVLIFQDEFGTLQPISRTAFRYSYAFLEPEPLYKLSLEGLIVSNLRCTADGRIFFSADDCLFELEYYNKTWYSGYSCKKVNLSKGLLTSIMPMLSFFTQKDDIKQLEVDNSRHLIYVLYKGGGVQIYDLGVDGKSTQKFGVFPREQLQHDCTNICNVTPEFFKEIVSVSVMPATVSYNIYFILTTAKGVRIYFSCLNTELDSTNSITQQDIRPVAMRIVQIRFPPSEQSFSLKGINIYSSYITNEASLMASDLGADQANLWVFTSANFPYTPRTQRFHEHNMVLPVSGAVWTITKASEDKCTPAVRNSQYLPREEPPLIVRQHLCPTENFLVLTAKGVLTFANLAPVEVFRRILARYGPESKEFHAFIQPLPKHEICIMAIIVLCSDNSSDVNIKDVALRAFFVHGGEPQFTLVTSEAAGDALYANGRAPVADERTPRGAWSAQTNAGSLLQSPRTPRMSGLFTDEFIAPLRTSTPNEVSPRDRTFNAAPPLVLPSPVPDEIVAGAPSVMFSARHDALKIYYQRILAPILDCQLCYLNNERFASSFSADLMEEVKRFVATYKRIIDEYSLISTTSSTYHSYSARQHINDARDATYKEQEKVSLSNLRNEISLTLEILGLWSVLLEFSDEDFSVIISALPQSIRKELLNWNFENLFKNRENVCAEMIACIVRFYIGDDASTNAISKRLRDICPSIFTMDDAQVVKATENLYRVKSATNSKERKELIDEALITLQQSIQKLNLVHTCDLLLQIGHFEGIVDLALSKAESDDRRKLALIAYKRQITEMNGVPSDTIELSEAIRKRNDAYSCITEALEILHVVAQSTKNPVSSITLNASTYLFPSADSVKSLGSARAKLERDTMLKRVFQSDDELANVAVFRWMLDHGMADVLLENKCRFFEAFLLHEIEQGKTGKLFDLLWKFNEKTGKYANAAKILFDMAKKSGNCPLNQRVTYLSQALMCIQTDVESQTNTELKTEIQDTLDIAQIQLRTKMALESNPYADSKRITSAVSLLNYNLYNLNELLAQFAKPFDLYEIQLDIIHCAEQYEMQIVENIWRAILDRELAKFSRKEEDEAAAQVRLGTLLRKMRRHFIQSLQFVPYSYILKHLMTVGLKKNVSGVWLSNICKAAEIPYKMLLTVLDREFRIDPFWKRNPRYLKFFTENIVAVCELFKQEYGQLQSNDRSVLREMCLNCLAQIILVARNCNQRSERLEMLQAEIERTF